MNSTVFYHLRKSPLARVFCCAVIVVIALGISFFFFSDYDNEPEIKAISPQIGAPGSIMTIEGKGFGADRDTSFVEIGGSSLTSSSYLSWRESEIRVQLPANVQDGLVYVVTKRGRSQPVIFANRENIPVAVSQIGIQSALPQVAEAEPSKLSVGQVLTITGSNFGSIRGESSFVYFTPTWEPDKSGQQEDWDKTHLKAQEADFDYESWSDTEILVRIPDGVASGSFFVKTDKGVSNQHSITITSPVGTKSFPDKRMYLVKLSADVSDVDMGSNSLLTLRVPRPQNSANQSGIIMTECEPPPIFDNYNRSVIHQLNPRQLTEEKIPFNQTFVIPVHSVKTDIKADKVQKFSDTSRLLYKVFTSPDDCVPSGDRVVMELSASIIGKETNPYRQARLIYDYMLDEYQLLHEILPKEISSLNLVTLLQGDAYDFAIIFTALCRAAGIPAIPISGILVDNTKAVQNHWWTEIYLENFGWMPVDISLAAGLPFPDAPEVENRRDFYFGNLDYHHVAFSRGWNKVNPTIINNKTVYRPKTYGLQSIWEEATTGTINYSSFWNDPVILGIY